MKAVVICFFLILSAGCAHAHNNSHTHSAKVPDAVKARCTVKAEFPRKCINRWKNQHTYTHSHANHHHHHHHAHKHALNHNESKVKLGVVVPIK